MANRTPACVVLKYGKYITQIRVYVCMHMCVFFKFYFACSITCSNTTCLLSYLQLLYNVYQYLKLLLYTTLVWIL